MDQEVRSSEFFTVLANLMDSQSHGMQSSQNNNNNRNPENSLRHNAIGTDTSLTENTQVDTVISQAMNAHILSMPGQPTSVTMPGPNGSASDAEMAEIERISAFMIPNFANSNTSATAHVSNDALYEATSHIGMNADVGNVLDSRLAPYTSNDFVSSQSQAVLGDLGAADAVSSLSCAQSYVSLLQQQSVDVCGNLWAVNASPSNVSGVGNFNGNSGNNKQQQTLGNTRTHGSTSLNNSMQSPASDKMSSVLPTQHRSTHSNNATKAGQRMQHLPRMVPSNKRNRASQQLIHNATPQYDARVENKTRNDLVLSVNHEDVRAINDMGDHRSEKKLTTTPIPSDDKSSCGSTSSGSLSGPEHSPDHPTERPSSSVASLSQNNMDGNVVIANKLQAQAQKDGRNLKNFPCYGNMNVFGTINFTPVMDNSRSSLPPGEPSRNGQDGNVPVPTSDSIIEIDETIAAPLENIPMSPTTPTASDPRSNLPTTFTDVQKLNFSDRSSFTQIHSVTVTPHMANASSHAHARKSKSKAGDQSKKSINGHKMPDANNNTNILQGYDKNFTSLSTVTQDKLQEKQKKPRAPKHRQTAQQRQDEFHSNTYGREVNQFSFTNNATGQPSHLKPKMNADPTTKVKPNGNTLLNSQFSRPLSQGSSSFTPNASKAGSVVISNPPYPALPCQDNMSQSVGCGAVVPHVTNRSNSSQPRQWQTVTAVQGPKLPPMLSEQDRIPKRGRPSKKTMQENLKIKKDAAASSANSAPAVVAQRTSTLQQAPTPSTVASASLVSTYTINDKGLMEEIAPKAKENRRSKERTQAFLKYLDEIKMYSKQQQTAGTTRGSEKEKVNGEKPKKRSRSRTKVFGRSVTQPLTESGITETMYTFSALAHQFKISTSIVERATENLLKSAAVKRNKEQQSAIVGDQQRFVDKNIGKNQQAAAIESSTNKGVTTSHCEVKNTSSKVPTGPTIKLPAAPLKKVDSRPAAVGSPQQTNQDALPSRRLNVSAAPVRNAQEVVPKISADESPSPTFQASLQNEKQTVPKPKSSTEVCFEGDLERSEEIDEHSVKEKHKKKKHKKHKKHKHLETGSGKKKKKDKERKKKSKKKLKNKLTHTMIPSSSVSLVKPATRPVLNKDNDDRPASEKSAPETTGTVLQEKGKSFSSGFRQSSAAEVDNSSSWLQDDNTYDAEDSSSDETSTSPKSCVDATSEPLPTPTSSNGLSSFAQYSNSRIGFGTFSIQKTVSLTGAKSTVTSTSAPTAAEQSDSSFVTQSIARSGKKHSKHRKKKFFRKSKACDPAFVAILDGLLINLKNLRLDPFSKRNQLSLTHPNSNIFLTVSAVDTPQSSLWKTAPPSSRKISNNIVKSTVFPEGHTSSSKNSGNTNMKESGPGKSSDGEDSGNPINSLSVFCRSLFFQKYGYITTSAPAYTASPNAALKRSDASTLKGKELTASKTVSKTAPPQSKTPLQQDKTNKHLGEETPKRTEERQTKKRRGWPLGKPRGPRAKRGRFLSESRPSPKSSLPLSDTDSNAAAETLAPATSDALANVPLPEPKLKPNLLKGQIKKDMSIDDLPSQDNQASETATTSRTTQSGKDLSKLVGESLLQQIKQAIAANLPAHPSINKDAITRSVDEALQSCLGNIKNTGQESPSVSEEKSTKKRGRRPSRNASARDSDGTGHLNGSSPKTTTDRHPKKLWAYKHQDTESSSSKGLSVYSAPVAKKRGPGRPRKNPIINNASAKRSMSKGAAAETRHGKVPTASATVVPTKRRLLTVRIPGKCVKPAVKRLLARAKNNIASCDVPKPMKQIGTTITREEALSCLSALCSIKAAKVIAKSGDRDGSSKTGLYAGTIIEQHMTETISATVEMYSWDNYKQFKDACAEVEKNMGFVEDCDFVLGDNKPKNPVVKKSIESVVEKLKNKQAQSMHSAAAALLELHNAPSTSCINPHDSDNVVVIDNRNPDTLERYRTPGRRQDIYEKVSSAKKDSNSSSKHHKVRTNRVTHTPSGSGSLKRPRGRPRKHPVVSDEEPQSKKSKTNAEKHPSTSEKDSTQNTELSSNKSHPRQGNKIKPVTSSEMNPSHSPRKPYLEAGLYSSTFKQNPKSSKSSDDDDALSASSSPAKLPPPFDAGLFLRSAIKDFQLPYDIWWMYKHKKISVSQEPSTNFVKITENIYSNPRPTLNLGDHICTCSLQDGGNCGKQCLNRLMYIECQPSSCPCGPSCTNQAMQRGQWCGKLERFRTKDKGLGVRSTESIAEGSFVLEYVGEVVSEAEFRARTVELYHAYNDHYCVQLDTSTVIDGYRTGNQGRFVNHSCEPNCEMQKWCVNGEHRIGLFALRDIQPNEELTYDYNFHAYNINTQQVCRCGSQKCRGFIGGRGQRLSSTDSDTPVSGPSPSTKISKPSGKVKSKSQKAKDEEAAVKEFSILQMKPIPKRDKEVIRSRQLFLLRNLRQVRKKEEEQRKKIEKKSGEGATSKSSHKSKPKKSHQSKEEKEKLEAALTEMYTAIATCKDQNGVSVAIPFMNLPSKKKNPEYYERISDPIDLSVIERNLMSNHYKDIEAFNGDVQRVFKNAEKYHGRKSTLGKDVIRLRKAYANARGAAMLLLNGHKKPTKSSEVSDEDLDETDENIHRKNEDHIRCICGIFKDEGLMVQCEKCYVWQHCDCMGVKPDNTDRYLCEECDPRPFSREVKVVPPPPYTPHGHTYYLTLFRDGLLVKQGDCAYLMRDHRLRHNSNVPSMRASHRNLANIPPDKLDIFRVEQLWTDERGDKYAYGYHFLRPHETHHSPSRTFYHNELFASPFNEIIPLEAVVGLCCVMDLYTYCKGKPKDFKMSDIYICDYRIDKAAGLFTCIKKKKYPICTKPHVFDTYKHKLCPKKDFRPHQVPEQYRKPTGRPPAGNGTAELDAPEIISQHKEDENETARTEDEDDDESRESEDPGERGEVGSSVWKKKQRLDGIAHKLLSKLPKQAVDISYLLEPGNGKRQRKKTQLSLESLGQRK